MQPSFLQRYLKSFESIEGWFSFDAAILFLAYNQLLARHGTTGDVLEIGVHHGLSSIGVAALRGAGRQFTAIDVFEELRDRNVSQSGDGKRDIFEQNMRGFHPGAETRVWTRVSSEIDPAELGQTFTFCHIDGGHSRAETLADLSLCAQVSAEGGLIALDDYFNPEFPGVSEGAVEFLIRNEGVLFPIAVGFGKVLFQKRCAFGLNAEFAEAFAQVPVRRVEMWGRQTLLFQQPLRNFFDLYASTPERLIAMGTAAPLARLYPKRFAIQARRCKEVSLAVAIANVSSEVFPAGERIFGLSYHLLTTAGETIAFDNNRAWLREAIEPAQSAEAMLTVIAPGEKGNYVLELDLVWEGVMWFADVGNPTVSVALTVR